MKIICWLICGLERKSGFRPVFAQNMPNKKFKAQYNMKILTAEFLKLFRPGKKLRYLTQKIGAGLMRQDKT